MPASRKTSVYPILSLVSLAIPLALQVLWIYVFNTYASPSERLTHFLGLMPGFLKDPSDITKLSMALCVLSMIFAYKIPTVSGTWRGVQLLIFVVAGGIFLLNLWSLL